MNGKILALETARFPQPCPDNFEKEEARGLKPAATEEGEAGIGLRPGFWTTGQATLLKIMVFGGKVC
jgi:hypothetical protein